MSAFRSLATRPPASLETVPTFSADRIDVVSGGTAVGQRIYRIVNLYTGLDLEVNRGILPTVEL
jgi:hypothetical protein